MKNLKQRVVTAVLLAAPVVAMAQGTTAQPDPSAGTAYITAGAVTVLAVANVKYIIQAVKWVAGKVGSMFGR